MQSGNKRASALSKLFEELLARHSGGDQVDPTLLIEIEAETDDVDPTPEGVILEPGGKPSESKQRQDKPSGGSELMCVLKKLLETLSS